MDEASADSKPQEAAGQEDHGHGEAPEASGPETGGQEQKDEQAPPVENSLATMTFWIFPPESIPTSCFCDLHLTKYSLISSSLRIWITFDFSITFPEYFGSVY